MTERTIDFVGGAERFSEHPGSAVYVEPATGDVYLVGRRITDAGTLAKLAEHVPIRDDETSIWLPADVKSHLLKALTGEYGKERQGHSEPSFEQLLASCKRSVIHLEARYP